ncbi:MAG: hypothetical protein AAGE86_12745 [Pseudomonadota bacterium]
MSELADVLGNPEWLPHSLDAANNRIALARIPQEVRDDLTFLADFKPSSDREVCWLSLRDFVENAPQARPVHFIFHSAFCRSTLLVQALGALEGVAGLSEPLILNHLQSAGPAASSLVAPTSAWLSRPMSDERAVIVKPSNFANGTIPQLLDQNRDAKGVLLFGELGAFLRSVAKKGLGGRIWARRQLAHCRAIMPLDLGMDEKAHFELTDLQCAGLAWLFQMRQFKQLLDTRSDTLRSLASDDFISDKAGTLAACAQWFGIDTSAADITDVAEGPLFSSHAKLGGDFSAIQAEQSKAAESAVVDEEIAQIEQWIGVIMRQLGLTLPLARPLGMQAA